MGSKASKVTRAAGTGARKYPSRLPRTHSSQTTATAGPSSVSVSAGPSVNPKTHISWEKDDGTPHSLCIISTWN